MKTNFNHAGWVTAFNEVKFSPQELVKLAVDIKARFIWHPLGFVMCKLSDEGDRKIRLHIWPNDRSREQKPTWLIHDHLFDLKSWVLAGKIENTVYGADSSPPNFRIYQASYVNDKSILNRTKRTLSIKEESKSVIASGGVYEVQSGILHRSISLSNKTSVTVCETINKLDKNPVIAGSLSGEKTYSYTRSAVSKTSIQDLLNNI